MKNGDYNKARNQTKLILGSTQLSVIIHEWSNICTKDLFTKIGKNTECVTQAFIDTYLQFAGFFHYSINLRLFQELEQNRYKEVSEEIIRIFSNTFVKVFYQEKQNSSSNAINAYANEVNSFIHDSISWYVERVMSKENKNEDIFIISISLLSYFISQKLGLEDFLRLFGDIHYSVIRVIDTNEINQSIAMLAI